MAANITPITTKTAGPGFVAGDVVEIDLDGETTTALVLLVSDAAAIFDRCDGSTPVVLPLDELPAVRVFSEALAA